MRSAFVAAIAALIFAGGASAKLSDVRNVASPPDPVLYDAFIMVRPLDNPARVVREVRHLKGPFMKEECAAYLPRGVAVMAIYLERIGEAVAKFKIEGECRPVGAPS